MLKKQLTIINNSFVKVEMLELYRIRVVRGAKNSQQTSNEDILNIHLSESEEIFHLRLKLLKMINLSIREHGVDFFRGGFGIGKRLNRRVDKVKDGDILFAVVRLLDLSSKIEKIIV